MNVRSLQLGLMMYAYRDRDREEKNEHQNSETHNSVCWHGENTSVKIRTKNVNKHSQVSSNY